MRLTRATAVQWLELESLDSGLASLSSPAWDKSTWVRGASGRTLDRPAGALGLQWWRDVTPSGD